MASTVSLYNYTTFCSPKTLEPFKSSLFLSSKSVLKLKARSSLRFKKLKARQNDVVPVIAAAQSNFIKVIRTVWKVGKDGVEAGTDMVPDSVPRPIAKLSVTVVGVSLALFVLKSFLSTAFFALAVMGLCYFAFLALNKDEGSKGGGGTTYSESSTDDSLEEARRIMEKYK
ncbi:Rho GTPase-activating protein like [Heracleum sosnowskyi]|uniref:Rho GTPase-activating protein like n=1 Tax=Heracleum sosnowskyi TaxID=360622 RepID=A0AAD8J8D3_9APIA|nr:Rho GTPase-activating protein like [Heracleum sosnowskyi]